MSDVHSDAASRLRTVLSSVASSSGSVREQLASHRAARAVGVATGLAAGGLFYSTVIERNAFTLRHATMSVLEPGAAPLRVLHISDLHMMPNQRLKQAWVSELESLEPDLVVNTGDNLGHAEGLTGIRRAFAPLAGVPGVFVHGSNDLVGPRARNPLRYFQGPSKRHVKAPRLDTAAMDAFFTDELGWNDVNNGAAALTVRGARVNAFGVSDAHRDWDDLPVLPAAIAALPADDTSADAGRAPLTVGVTHAPYRRVLDRFVDLGADMIFAGHTHGGQVRIPFSRSALVANCDIPLDQARGLSTWTHVGRTVPLNVSAGLGHSIYAPVRFGCRPEASVLILRPIA